LKQGVKLMTIFLVNDERKFPRTLIEEYRINPCTSSSIPETDHKDLILCWGENINLSGAKGWVLNSFEGYCNSLNWREVLSHQGISIAEPKQKFQRSYLAYVFNLTCIGLYSEQKNDVWISKATNKKEKLHEIPLNKNTLELRKVKKLAVRTIHALGLDFGMVFIGVKEKKQYVIKPVPYPTLSKQMSHRFGEAILKLQKNLAKEIKAEQIILGADPEFVLKHKNGKFIMASSYFSKSGEVGCDQIWLSTDETKKRLPLAEIRPDPSSDPKRLVYHIYRSLFLASEKINNPDVEFLAGSTPLKQYPIGGHIHFSKIDLNSFFLRALDNYLALPILLIEDPKGLRRRPRYGFLGDFREQFHGGFEYRTLPSWLISPCIAKGVLSLAKLIAAHYPDLRSTPLSDPAILEAFYRGEQEQLIEVVMRLWSELEEMPLYKEYQSELDQLKESIFIRECWDEKMDIRPKWRIPPFDRR